MLWHISWTILRTSVEQEILFPSELCFDSYIESLNRKDEPYEIISKIVNEDGTMTVVMRKRYNNNRFLHRAE